MASLLTMMLQGQTWFYNYYEGGNPSAANGVPQNFQGDDEGEIAGWTKVAGTFPTAIYSQTVQLPFAFSFGGDAVTAFKASGSGFITFDTSVSGSAPAGPALLPSALLPAKSVVIWGLSSHGSNDKILTRTFGQAPNRQFWIKFSSFSTPGDTLGTYTYAAIVLNETDSRIFIVDMHQGAVFNPPAAPRMNPGIQQNSTIAVAIDNQTTKTYYSGLSKRPADNRYYQFVYGNRPGFDLDVTLLNSHASASAGNALGWIFSVTNQGADTADSTTLFYQLNGGAVQSLSIQPSAGFLPSRLSAFRDTISLLTPAPAGNLNTLVAWVEKANNTAETNRSNDTFRAVWVTRSGNAAGGRILLEAGTAAWCSECPVSQRMLESIQERYKDTVILVNQHSLDFMASQGDEVNSRYMEKLPQVLVNRSGTDGITMAYSADSAWKAIEQMKAAYTPVTVRVENVALNESTRVFTFRVTAVFTDYHYGSISLGGIVLEDKVRGVGVGFNQTIDRKYTTDPSNWYYNFSTPIIGYYHQAVAWDMPGGSEGIQAGGGKVLWQPGDSVSQDFSYTFPALLQSVTISQSPYLPTGTITGYWKPADMAAAGFVSSKGTEYSPVLNAAYSRLWDTSLSVSRQPLNRTITVYPNPSNGKITIIPANPKGSIAIYSLSGKKVFEVSYENEHRVMLDLQAAGLQNGIYSLEINGAKGQRYTAKMILNR